MATNSDIQAYTPQGEMVIYRTDDGKASVDVILENETVWLTQEQIAVLFGKSKSTISEHLHNIFNEHELVREVVVRKFRTTTQHGAIKGKTQEHLTDFYNLDVIIAVGFRVRSQRGTQFRQWATERIKEYIVKGYTLDVHRLGNI